MVSTPLQEFLCAVFSPNDIITLRWIETWNENSKTKHQVQWQGWPTLEQLLTNFDVYSESVEIQRANQFFGVCPRVGIKDFDHACQVRTVRALWADVDHCSPDEAIRRCNAAGLPRPSIAVNSGYGAHLYWLLDEPFLIDDADTPTILNGHCKRKTLSPKAAQVQGVVQGIVTALGGDAKTHDLVRLLRLPETLNRKDARNGKPPVPCQIVDMDAKRRFRFEDFAAKTKVISTGIACTTATSAEAAPLIGAAAGVSDSSADSTAIRWLDDFVERHQIEVQAVKDGGSWVRRWVLVTCPFCGESDSSAVVTLAKSGKYGFTCQHSRCNGKKGEKKTWSDFRRHYEGLPAIQVNNRQLREITEDAIAAIEAANEPPQWFERGGLLFRLRTEDMPCLELLKDDGLRNVLARVADWINRRTDKDGKVQETAVFPPLDVVKDVAASARRFLPPITGIVRAPVFTPQGLVACRGYHAESGLYCDHDAIHESHVPTAEERAWAKGMLLNELLGDFPFVDDASRAHALAMLLLPFVRPLIDGPTPLHLIDAPTEGTGKGLLANCFGVVSQGVHQLPSTDEPSSPAVWGRKLTSELLSAPSFIFIDNVNSAINSGAFAAVLTAGRHRDRLLGTNKTVELPVQCVWLATGNNVKASKEITRRVCWIRMDADVENPNLRTGFRHPDLLGWAMDHRAELVRACLVLVQAWVAAGSPRGSYTLGSFEKWAGIIGGILDVAGVPGFLGNLTAQYQQINTSENDWRALVSLWWLEWRDTPVAVSDLYQIAERENLCTSVMNAETPHGRQIKLGLALAKLLGKVYGPYKVMSAGKDKHRKAGQYQLVRLDELATSPDPGERPMETSSELASTVLTGPKPGSVQGHFCGLGCTGLPSTSPA